MSQRFWTDLLCKTTYGQNLKEKAILCTGFNEESFYDVPHIA